MRPLVLTDAQRAMIEQAAARLPIDRREEFLRAIAARLGERPTLLALEQAIGLALERARVIDGTAK